MPDSFASQPPSASRRPNGARRNVKPIPRAGLRFYLLDDRGLLLDPTSERIYALNRGGAFLWCCLKEGLSLSAIAALVQRRSRLSHAAATVHVAAALEEWRRLGLIVATRPEPPPRRS